MGKILVLAEKPSAGKDYAGVLGCNERHNGYLEGDNYVVTWTVGHLITLKEPHEYKDEWKKWDIELLPMIPDEFDIKVTEKGKAQFQIIKSLINRKDITSIINGGDAGREGELIQRYVLQMANNKKPVQRLWVSSLTKDAIEDGFKNLRKASDFDKLYESALARAQVDWLYGLNYTRLFTKKFGNGKDVLSTGRCQTPLLRLIVDRDYEIDTFKPVPYYELIADFKDYVGKYIKNSDTKIMSKEDANKIVKDIKNNKGKITEVKEEKKSIPAPLLYNLNSLGQKMNRKYGFSAQKTLDVLQSLYETHKIATYPRASAKVISVSIFNEVKSNIGNIAFGDFADYVPKLKIKMDKRYVNDSKIEDHHAIIPDFKNRNISSIYPKLSRDEKLLFDELVKSVLAIFMPNYEYASTVLTTTVNGHDFITRGQQELQIGWKSLYRDEKEFEEVDSIGTRVSKGDIKGVVGADVLSKQTKPKARYTEAQLLSDMEKFGIGTQATMPGLIETLKSRNYISENKKALISTNFGKEFIKIINIDDIKSVELTALLEKKLEEIIEGKITREDLIRMTTDKLEENIDKVNESEEVMTASEDSLGICPFCKKGYVRETKFGFGCSDYKSGCKFSIGEMYGKKIVKSQVKTLISKGSTDTIKGFVSQKTGKTFDAKLKLDLNEKKIVPDFGTGDSKSEFTCPKCKKPMFDSDKVCKCSDCDIVIFKTMAEKKLTSTIIKQLLTKGQTSKMKGFKSKAGKDFEAAIKLNDKGRTEFVFD